jgi:uncharacterized protein YprB with RNaseH-like and TPR domain
MSDQALRRRLRRLDRKRGAKPLRSRAAPSAINELPPGEELETPFGQTLRIETKYPLDYMHGNGMLSGLLEFKATLAAEVARDPGLGEIPMDRLAFLDTETTGLTGGTGTIAFLVGIGAFVGDAFRLRQYFLRDPSEEAGLLHALQADLELAAGFVSFNGRSFDLPLLELRYMMGLRRRWMLNSIPHLDLLHSARRLWRRSLPDCSLGTIERWQLGVKRTEEDVPGEAIPGMYIDYLRTGDTSEMARVVYHNTVDVLSLVRLAEEVLKRHLPEDPKVLLGAEALAIARWHHGAGRLKLAEEAYLAALASQEEEIRLEALRHYSIHLKRYDRRGEAVEHWREWHHLALDDPRPCVELAKYYEWHVHDLEEARRWAKEALACLTHWPADWRRDQTWGDIEHRLARLARKTGGE